jgi:hypothetical protein
MKPRRDWIPPTVDDVVAYPITRGQLLLFAGWFVLAGVTFIALPYLGVAAELRAQQGTLLVVLGGMSLLVALGAAAWRYMRWLVVLEGKDAVANVTDRKTELTSNGVLTRLALRFNADDGPLVGSRLVHPVVWRSVEVGGTVRVRYMPSHAHRWVAVGEYVRPPYPPQWRHLARMAVLLILVELSLGALYLAAH